jgi:hypothetical protein
LKVRFFMNKSAASLAHHLQLLARELLHMERVSIHQVISDHLCLRRLQLLHLLRRRPVPRLDSHLPFRGFLDGYLAAFSGSQAFPGHPEDLGHSSKDS